MLSAETAEYDRENIKIKPLLSGAKSSATGTPNEVSLETGSGGPKITSLETGSGGREEHTNIVKMLITKRVIMHSSEPRPIVTLGC